MGAMFFFFFIALSSNYELCLWRLFVHAGVFGCYVFFSCLLVATMSCVFGDFLYTRAIWLIEIFVIWESKDGISFLLFLDVYPTFAHFKKMCSNKSKPLV